MGNGDSGGGSPRPDDTARGPLSARWRALSRVQKGLATGATAAALAVVGWLVNWGMPKLVDWIDPPAEVSVSSRLLIVDTSASMTGKIGSRKFNLAVSQIRRIVGNAPDVAVALRTAGGACTEGYREPLVKFEPDNGSTIQAELDTVRTGGPANIVSQLEQGVNDFQKFDTAKSAKVQSIWLFLGTARDCRAEDIPLGEAIKQALVDSPAKVSYVDFFVLRGDRKSFANLKKSIEPLGAEFFVREVRTQEKLVRAVDKALETEKPSD